MKNLDFNEINQYVEDNIGTFHDARIEGIKKLKLIKILKSKNPYLFKAKNLLTAESIVKALLDAHLSSNEETIFGEFLEKFAIFICGKVYGGRKISTVGIDLDFDKDDSRYLVSIKSGPNWGNKAQQDKLALDFNTAKRTLNTNSVRQTVICVNGCCYGKDYTDKGIYLKICGQEFWKLISGDETLYTKIIEPLGYKAKEKNEEFNEKYCQTLNKFTHEFMENFCTSEGEIMWEEIVKLNSGKKEMPKTKKCNTEGNSSKKPKSRSSKTKSSNQTSLLK